MFESKILRDKRYDKKHNFFYAFLFYLHYISIGYELPVVC